MHPSSLTDGQLVTSPMGSTFFLMGMLTSKDARMLQENGGGPAYVQFRGTRSDHAKLHAN